MMEFWTGENPIVASPLNHSVDDIRLMDDLSFADWAEKVRSTLRQEWIEHGIPPHDGTPSDEIERDMRKISTYSTTEFLQHDEDTGRNTIVAPDGRCGAFLRSLFTNMSKSGDGNAGGLSIFDYISADENTPDGGTRAKNWCAKLDRMVRRDSMYAFSRSLNRASLEACDAKRGVDWLDLVGRGDGPDAGYLLDKTASVTERDELTLGRSDAYHLTRFGQIAPERFGLPKGSDPHKAAKALNGTDVPGVAKPWMISGRYRIRTGDLTVKVFPALFSMLRTGLVVQGTNFPPLVAKFLYQHFTESIKDQPEIVIYDPSAGYGGRCLGALAAACDRPIRYIATDPNSDNWITQDRSRYDVLADHYRATVGQTHHAKIEVFCSGSEVIHENPAFQKYQGLIDLVFTSPPYFCAELYSQEATQSAIKFPTYPEWREGFLRRTLTTCAEYLKPGGYLLWNIADVKIGSTYVPLEQDSLSIIQELGLELIDKLKMPLATVTGGGKIVDGMPTTKNFLTLRGNLRKYEPIFVFRKSI